MSRAEGVGLNELLDRRSRMNEYKYTPTITQLIERLESIRAAHGNVQVYLDDPDTAWTMPIGCAYLDVQAAGTMPPHVTITASYYGPPEEPFSEV